MTIAPLAILVICASLRESVLLLLLAQLMFRLIPYKVACRDELCILQQDINKTSLHLSSQVFPLNTNNIATFATTLYKHVVSVNYSQSDSYQTPIRREIFVIPSYQPVPQLACNRSEIECVFHRLTTSEW
jgi:hypothetical protein